jgi:hypothetical protein
LFGAVIAVPLTRQRFGLREERVAVHLVIGARELRLFFAFTRYYAVIAATLLAFAIAAGVAISQGTQYAAAHGLAHAWLGVPLQTWLNSAAAALAVLLFLAFAVRFGFLLDAIGAVEDRAKLTRARALSRNNFWRIALTLFIVTVPAGLLFAACETTFGGLTAGGQGYFVAPAETAKFVGVLTVALVVLHGLLAGASATAYSEMAEAAALENEPVHETTGYSLPQAAMAFASMDSHHAEPRFGADAPLPPMEIATFEAAGAMPVETVAAETAPEAAPAETPETPPETKIVWMPPPPDAHFGSDPHDALAHDGGTTASVESAPAIESPPAVESAPTVEPVKTVEPLAEAVAAADASATGAEGLGAPPVVAAVQQDTSEIPDHAHDAELPAPPVQPELVDA